MFQSLRRADGPADGDGDRPDEPDEQAESGGWAPADGYSTAYCDGSASDDEVDDSYWTGAWTETAAGDGAEATAGPQEPAPENQWPPPRHWPCPPAASGAPCAAEVSVLPGKGRSALAITKLSPGDEVGLERPFAFVVREEYAGSACANCCAACGKESSSTASFVFCTPTCENEAMRDTGAVYFQNLEKLGAIAKDCSVDVSPAQASRLTPAFLTAPAKSLQLTRFTHITGRSAAYPPTPDLHSITPNSQPGATQWYHRAAAVRPRYGWETRRRACHAVPVHKLGSAARIVGGSGVFRSRCPQPATPGGTAAANGTPGCAGCWSQ